MSPLRRRRWLKRLCLARGVLTAPIRAVARLIAYLHTSGWGKDGLAGLGLIVFLSSAYVLLDALEGIL